MNARAVMLSAILAGCCVPFALRAAEGDEMLIVKLYNGIEHKGIVDKVDDDTITLATGFGLRTFRRTDIITSRKELTPDERAAIRRDVAAAKQPASPAKDLRGISEIRAADARDVADLKIARRNESLPVTGGHMSAMERISRKLDRKVSVELVDSSLADAMEFLQNLTGLTIIIDPKVRELKPTLSLRVQDMDAATALRWMTKLTDTYAEIKDQAVWITNKPSATEENEERTHIINMAAAARVDITLPPEGVPLTDADRAKIALQLWEKEQPVVTDFPGPDISLGSDSSAPIHFGGK
jgi:hypothetical protein